MPTFEFSGEIAGAPKEDLFDNLGAKIKVNNYKNYLDK